MSLGSLTGLQIDQESTDKTKDEDYEQKAVVTAFNIVCAMSSTLPTLAALHCIVSHTS